MTGVKVVAMVCVCIVVFRTVCAVAKSTGYYCTGTAKGNLHLKCATTPCKGTSCKTTVDYEDASGPDAVIIDDSARKILVNLEMANISIIHVLFINYVRYSADKRNTVYRLTRPVVVKVQLNKIGELYKLRFIHFVNGGPAEEVINKDTRENYFGCDSRRINPTCGMLYYGLSEPVPFSEGFCCSCIDSVNAARQPRPLRYAAPPSDDGCATVAGNEFQPRGGQDCKNISTSPSYANQLTYHESSHCFRYSDLWFNVYAIEQPETFIPLAMNVYGKNDDDRLNELHQDCCSTATKPVLLRSTVDGKPTTVSSGPVSLRYTVRGLTVPVTNDLHSKYVLIPQEVPEAYRTEFTQANTDEPNKFLAIDPSWMTGNGTECDKVGVQPEAFNEQPDRCSRARGSCLGRQPLHLLRKPVAGPAKDCDPAGRRVFVGDYIPGPIRYDDATETLIVERGNPGPAAPDGDAVCVRGQLEIGFEDNAVVVDDRVLLQITEIHGVFDDNGTRVVVRVYVTNLGLKTAEFYVGVSDRNPRRDGDEKRTAHPQQTVECHLELECLANDCTAITRLYAADCTDTVVAYRKFDVVRGCRCYCMWRARCECYGPYSGRPRARGRSALVQALGQTEYNGAGFPGDVPPGTAADAVAARDRNTVSTSLRLLAGFAAVAIALGLAKAASPYRSHWLWMVPSDCPSPALDEYKEPDIRLYRVVRDECGYCVHPTTKSRNIRLFDRPREFAVNAVFFFNLPATLCWYSQRPVETSSSSNAAAV